MAFADERDGDEGGAGAHHRPTPGPVFADAPADHLPERNGDDGSDKIGQDKKRSMPGIGTQPMLKIDKEQCRRNAVGKPIQKPGGKQSQKRPIA